MRLHMISREYEQRTILEANVDPCSSCSVFGVRVVHIVLLPCTGICSQATKHHRLAPWYWELLERTCSELASPK
eukprot:3329404-Amphidinium_carterae.1